MSWYALQKYFSSFSRTSLVIRVTTYLVNTKTLSFHRYDCKDAAKTLIFNNADCSIQNSYGQTALHFAARRGNAGICTLILSHPNIDVNVADNGMVRTYISS